MTSDLGRVIFGSMKKIALSILHGSGARSNTRLDTHCERAMATPEQINATVRVAVEASVSRLMEGLMPMIAATINTGGGGTTGNGGFGPSGKIFRDIGKFGGEEGAWAEWALKFQSTVKEYDAGLCQALEMAGDTEVEIDMTEVACRSRSLQHASSLNLATLNVQGWNWSRLDPWNTDKTAELVSLARQHDWDVLALSDLHTCAGEIEILENNSRTARGVHSGTCPG